MTKTRFPCHLDYEGNRGTSETVSVPLFPLFLFSKRLEHLGDALFLLFHVRVNI